MWRHEQRRTPFKIQCIQNIPPTTDSVQYNRQCPVQQTVPSTTDSVRYNRQCPVQQTVPSTTDSAQCNGQCPVQRTVPSATDSAQCNGQCPVQQTVPSTTAMQSFKSTEMLSSKSLVSSCGGSGSTMDNNRTWRLSQTNCAFQYHTIQVQIRNTKSHMLTNYYQKGRFKIKQAYKF